MVGRLLVAIPLAAAVVAMLWHGAPWLWQSATLVAALWAIWEWGQLGRLSRPAGIGYLILSAVFFLTGKILLDSNFTASEAMFAVACFFWVAIAPWMMLWQIRCLRTIPYYALGMLIIFAAWYSSAVMFSTAPHVLTAVLVLVWTADSAAYFTGRMWGQTKMSPNISPGKTWEGFFGGMMCSLALTLIFGSWLFDALPPALLLSATAVLVALSVQGDLFESSLKRESGVKDSGTILGGHGGVLDRLDAMLPTLPFGALISSWLT